MADNKVSEGKVFEFAGVGDEVSGGIKIFDDMCGVNLDTLVTGEVGSAAVEGVWEVPKATGLAVAQGEKLGAIGLAAVAAATTGAVPLGNAASAAAAGAGLATVQVRLNSW